MTALRYASLLLVASCGGFLPFFGDDEDESPPPTVGADAATNAEGGSSSDPSDATASIDGFSVVSDGGLSQSDAIVACKSPPGSCTLASTCCAGSICGPDASCCVPGGLYANAKDHCCGGDGVFEGFSGYRCLDVR